MSLNANLWSHWHPNFNLLTPNDNYSGRTAPLTSKCCILYIYSTNIGTEYFKHGIYSPSFPLQNAVCFINLTYLVPVLFTFHIQDVLNKKNNSGAKRLRMVATYFNTFQIWYGHFEKSELHSVPRYTQSRIVFFDWYSEVLPCVLNMYIASYRSTIASISISDFPSTISAGEPLLFHEIFLGFSNILNSHSIQPHKRNSILYSAPYILVRWHTANTQNYNIDSGIWVPDGGDHE